ncbi:MAG: thioredoxin family protein [Spirochaetia bacterium]|jgi:small redox-active disulfide protein 2|nr:thioredoxin family protein [Spirochaetia bacterium]
MNISEEKATENGEKKGLVQVLGSGCPKCQKMESNAKVALEGTGYEVGHLTDIGKIMQMGVMSTPALAIDGKVVSSGKVLSPAEIKKLVLQK